MSDRYPTARDDREYAESRASMYKRQRDELLAAAKLLTKRISSQEMSAHVGTWNDFINAIAKAEGGR